MKKLPIGKQNFKSIIEDGYLYVDKTRQIYDLVNEASLYFLSRPRRFGKTLLLATLSEIFKGNKDLFKGLYIAENTPYEWTTYPVLQFNFAKLNTNPVHFESSLKRQLSLHAATFQVELTAVHLIEQVDELVAKIAKIHGPVVFLVDEYDKPIIDFLRDPKQADINRGILKSFFAPLKDLEKNGHLRFLFITGVSKFSKVSLFSDLNNLTDLTIDSLAVDLVGITQEELSTYFKEYIQQSAKILLMSEKKVMKGVKVWYNGYSYDGKTFLYNPFSLLSFFRKSNFGNFWFATGTPTFLVNLLRDRQIEIDTLEGKEVSETFFDKFSLRELDTYGLLFQTGYLTIKSTRRRGWQLLYKLAYPNEEVRQAFTHNLLEAFTYQASSTVSHTLLALEAALQEGNIAAFIEQLEILFSDISYHLVPKGKKNPSEKDQEALFAAWEGYFHTIIYLICTFLNLNVQSEISKHQGRLDLLLETEDFLYLMEFKLAEPATNAIAQIKSRKYAQSYKNSPKTVFLVGIGFSKEARNVETWEAEKW